MPRTLTVGDVEPRIGESVRDPYGRTLGKLVSFESDVDGTIKTIVVENEDKTISFHSADAVKINEKGIEVVPEWKLKATKVIEQYKIAMRRLKGLEELHSRGEISSVVYREIRKKLDSAVSKLKEEAKKVKEMMKKRMNEIEDDNLKLDRAIAELKVSYIAGEISETAYKTAIEQLRQAKDSNAKELEDLKKMLKQVENIESGSFEVTMPKTTKEKTPSEKTSVPTSASQQPQPITVHIVG